jgi:hypothetical protein
VVGHDKDRICLLRSTSGNPSLVNHTLFSCLCWTGSGAVAPYSSHGPKPCSEPAGFQSVGPSERPTRLFHCFSPIAFSKGPSTTLPGRHKPRLGTSPIQTLPSKGRAGHRTLMRYRVRQAPLWRWTNRHGPHEHSYRYDSAVSVVAKQLALACLVNNYRDLTNNGPRFSFFLYKQKPKDMTLDKSTRICRTKRIFLPIRARITIRKPPTPV